MKSAVRGALKLQPNAMDRPPALRAYHAGWDAREEGSWAANGIAPSVMKEDPLHSLPHQTDVLFT